MSKNNFSQMCGQASDAIYGMGFLGAIIYYFQHSSTLPEGVLGIFKAVFWPAFFVYKAIELWQI